MDLITDLAPYRTRAAQLVADIIAGKVTAADEAHALLEKLDTDVVRPLTVALDAVPLEARGGSKRADLDQHDAVGQVVDALAGVYELGVLLEWIDGHDFGEGITTETGRALELAEAGIRYRALMAGAPS